jgi:hypothetical protein
VAIKVRVRLGWRAATRDETGSNARDARDARDAHEAREARDAREARHAGELHPPNAVG